ncbi:hypothetical protein EDC96DRAFT_511613 [Choanephora cucurbitarum]|nr:hypothetical protein EDC96DRAFT_511613 [Choanephora cucurbitarum]
MNTPTRKRTHLKPSQVALLQESFDNNPLPDASVRSKLARELSVSERTIQIWFQNRRAKARKVDVASSSQKDTSKPQWTDSDRHNTPPRYQATFRTMMTPERFQELKQENHHIRRRPRSISKPEPKTASLVEIAQASTRAMSEGIPEVPFTHDDFIQPCSAEIPIQMVTLPVSVLRIGSWTRFAHATSETNQKEWDLVCYGSPADRELIWRVQAEGHHFRIQVSFDHIQQLRLSQQIQLETGEFVGQLEVESNLPLTFSMWRFGQDQQWVRCGDFTEDRQASLVRTHILQGNHELFKQALLDLIALAPELATKIRVMPVVSQAPPLDLCREFTISPSATPEPSFMAGFSGFVPQPMYGMINPQQLTTKGDDMSHLMLQAPFFYPNQQENEQALYQMMLQEEEDETPNLLNTQMMNPLFI